MTRLLPLSILLAGCAAMAAPGDGEEPASEESDLVAEQAKYDTGYLSTVATEIDGLFEGSVVVPAEEALLAAFENGDAEGLLGQIVTEQVQYATPQFKDEYILPNIGLGSEITVTPTRDGDTLTIEYSVEMETVISHESLELAGISDLSELLGRRYEARVPADPRKLLERIGEACSTYESSEEDPLEDWMYFYYFDPSRSGCEDVLPLSNAKLTLSRPVQTANVFPEYDLLRADGRIEVAAFFGASDVTSVNDRDLGVREWRQFLGWMERRGFRRDGVADAETRKGRRYVRERGGLTEVLNIISPFDLAALNHDTDGLFSRMVSSHEVVVYVGHSFYGSLNVLQDRETFAPDTYQVFFIGSCSSYAYYTHQIFGSKATEDDPTGWALADVVNQGTSQLTRHRAEFARIFLTNLLAGAEVQGRDGTRVYDWRNILDRMNQFAIDEQKRYNGDYAEILGASGVRTNRFQPPESK